MEFDDLTAFVNMMCPQNLGDDEEQTDFLFWFEEAFLRIFQQDK